MLRLRRREHLLLPISTASRHLSRLKTAGLLTSRAEGKLVFHSLARPSLPGLIEGLVDEG